MTKVWIPGLYMLAARPTYTGDSMVVWVLLLNLDDTYCGAA